MKSGLCPRPGMAVAGSMSVRDESPEEGAPPGGWEVIGEGFLEEAALKPRPEG